MDFVNDLNPITYRWDKRSKYLTEVGQELSSVTPDGTHKEDRLQIGFKAQEVEALEIAAGYSVANDTNLLVSVSKSGDKYGLMYSRFVPILVKAIQEQQDLIESLTDRIAALEGE